MSYLIKILCVISLFLVGCTSSNDLHKPAVLVMEQWPVQNHYLSQETKVNLPYLAWWNGFNDPVLNDLIVKGLRYNNKLNMSRGAIEAAEGELKKIKYQWIPGVDVMTGYSRNPALGYPGVLGVIIPSYVINIYQQIKEHKRAKYNVAQVKAEDDALKLTTISALCASYFTYQAEIEHRQLLHTLAHDLTQLARIAQDTHKGGLTSDIEQQELYSQAQVIHGELEVVEQNIILSKNAIRYLINLNPGEFKTKMRFSDLNNKQLIPSALPITVLENRPDLHLHCQTCGLTFLN